MIWRATLMLRQVSTTEVASMQMQDTTVQAHVWRMRMETAFAMACPCWVARLSRHAITKLWLRRMMAAAHFQRSGMTVLEIVLVMRMVTVYAMQRKFQVAPIPKP